MVFFQFIGHIPKTVDYENFNDIFAQEFHAAYFLP